MARALVLARKGLYSTPPNPSVGCVLVRDGQVVGEGYHRLAGGPHAEVVALGAAGERARGATAYVSLEPCDHQGRTPPCTEALLTAGVTRVVAALRDPNPAVAGGGIETLTRAGVEVAVGLLEHAAGEINRGFLSRMARGRPWVTAKMAASLDGRTALANGCSKWITGDSARSDVQRLRARASAVLTGIDTVIADDPRLTVRDASLATCGRQPLRVVLDSSLRFPEGAQLANGEAPTLIFAGKDTAASNAGTTLSGATVEYVATTAHGLDIDQCLRRLAELECNEVLVEAGPRLAGAMLDGGYVDELVVYLAPLLLGDAARPMLRLPAIEEMSQRMELEVIEIRQVGSDLRISLRARREESD